MKNNCIILNHLKRKRLQHVLTQSRRAPRYGRARSNERWRTNTRAPTQLSVLKADLRKTQDISQRLAQPISFLLLASMTTLWSDLHKHIPDMGWRLASRAICPVIAPKAPKTKANAY
ncbi:hypothetical protein TNCV_4375961 [Trichonephila clavipes]|nr:hypothetical protein TNCV_4375961 [Trichonephila clavipes]